MTPGGDLRSVLRSITRELDRPASLADLASRAAATPFVFHRRFHALVGETPKQYTLRLRLERSAGLLVATDLSILEIALETGFASHEVFIRAFRRRYFCTPTRYRASALAGVTTAGRKRHFAVARDAGPCVTLYHIPSMPVPRRPAVSIAITRQDIPEQPFLFIRRRAARNEIATVLGECFGKVFGHCMTSGLAMTGRPTARFIIAGPGLLTIEAGVPIATASPGLDEIEAGSLQGGPAAVGVYMGSYERLPEAYAEMERWIEAQGLQSAGPAWESYVTDPAEHPDPNTWRTDIYWPLN